MLGAQSPLASTSQLAKPNIFTYREQLPLYPDRLWRIERGVVRTLTWNEQGEIVALGLWGPSELVGQPLSTLGAYQIECLTAVEATLLIPPQWGELGATIAQQFQQAEMLASFGKQNLTRTKLMNHLGWIARKFGCDIPEGRAIDLRLTHQELAELVGTTRVTVTRLLGELEKEELLYRTQKQRLILRAPLEVFLSGNP